MSESEQNGGGPRQNRESRRNGGTDAACFQQWLIIILPCRYRYWSQFGRSWFACKQQRCTLRLHCQ